MVTVCPLLVEIIMDWLLKLLLLLAEGAEELTAEEETALTDELLDLVALENPTEMKVGS